MIHKQRDHVLEILYLNIRQIKDRIYPLLGMIVSMLGGHSSWKSIVTTGFYLLCGYIVIYSFLAWWNKTYSLQSDRILLTEGVVRRKQSNIPISHIRSIHTEDSLLKRICGVADLHMEIVGGGAVVFVLPKRSIEHLQKTLFQAYSSHSPVPRVKQYQLGIKDYLLLSTVSSQIFSASFALLFSVISFLAEKPEKEIPIKDTFAEIFRAPQAELLMLFLAVLMLLVINLIPTLLLLYMTYSNLSIERNENQLVIQYGLLKRKHIVIPVAHVRSLRLKETELLRIFGYVQVKVDIIGFGKESQTSTLLFPILKRSSLSNVLDTYLPEFQVSPLSYRPKKGVLIWYMCNQAVPWMVLVGLIGVVYHPVFYGLFVTVILLFLGYRKWKYTGLNWNSQFLYRSSASLFSIHTMIIKKEYVESTSVCSSLFSKRQGAADYVFSLYSEDLTEKYVAHRLSDSERTSFLSYLLEDR